MVSRNLRITRLSLMALCTAGAAMIALLGSTGSAFASAIRPTRVVPSVSRLVPARDRSETLLSPENATYAPDEFVASDGHMIEGMDPDLLRALAKVMGINVKFTNVPFDEIIPGLVSGKYLISASSIDDTKKREKQITLVDYARTGQTFFTTSDSAVALHNFGDMCGLTVAVEYGTTELSYVSTQSTQCLVAGSKPVTVMPFPNQTAVDNALRKGKADLSMADTPVADYLVHESKGEFKLVGKQTVPQAFGIALPKGSPLVPAVRAGLRYLESHGYYTAILEKWGVSGIALPASQVVVDGARR